jgi:hypothetical protein
MCFIIKPHHHVNFILVKERSKDNKFNIEVLSFIWQKNRNVNSNNN